MVKKLFNLVIIIIIYLVGNTLSNLLKPIFFIPGSIIGMLLLLMLLNMKIVNITDMEKSSAFFLNNMGFFFVPLSVGVMESFYLIKPVLPQLTVTIVISCLLVMVTASKVVDYCLKIKKEN